MNIIRFTLPLFLVLALDGYSQNSNPDSLLNKFRIDIQIEQREHSGMVVMDDETKISGFSLISNCSVSDLIKYTNDSNAFIRSYVFIGLLRKNASHHDLLKILNIHKNDTAKFTSLGAQVGMEWTVKDFMQAGMNLKLDNKLSYIDYKNEIKKIRNSVLKFKFDGVNHGLIDKKQFINIDSLTLTDNDLKVVSFTLFVAGQEMKSSGCIVTNDMKRTLEKAEAGHTLVFDDIKVINKDGKVMRLPLMSLKLK